MLLLPIVSLFATAVASPIIHYDQSQGGKINRRADISNVFVLLALPSKLPSAVLDFLSRSQKRTSDDHDAIQDRSDVRVMEAFVEPSKPYQVEIGSESSGQSAKEVVIMSRHRQGVEASESEQDDLKLLGATENCGPDRVRDSVTLMCKDTEPVKIESEPELQKQSDEKVQILELLPVPDSVIPS